MAPLEPALATAQQKRRVIRTLRGQVSHRTGLHGGARAKIDQYRIPLLLSHFQSQSQNRAPVMGSPGGKPAMVNLSGT